MRRGAESSGKRLTVSTVEGGATAIEAARAELVLKTRSEMPPGVQVKP